MLSVFLYSKLLINFNYRGLGWSPSHISICVEKVMGISSSPLAMALPSCMRFALHELIARVRLFCGYLFNKKKYCILWL